ncbi:MAG TPA: hypothetical protein VME43_24145 [Bryobacteraceae bacterium]|nr:hypothetical protein [Bryobacteraceae bacterium]
MARLPAAPSGGPIKWRDIDLPIFNLDTDKKHEIKVQREAIPLIFVPGIMGTCLRRAGTSGKDDLRWNPSSHWWMLRKYYTAGPAERKAMLVGARYNANYLEPNDSDPIGDGFASLDSHYCKKYLAPLKAHDWGALSKIFEFPVYGFGYNWTDSNEDSGRKLAARIQAIIAEARQIVGFCEKVILITHSMGGLVARAAAILANAESSILGIIHGVQPATGTPAAYWRMKAGFEEDSATGTVLGDSGPKVTAVLANIPGGLELLPNQDHLTDHGGIKWLTITKNGQYIKALPNSDPYGEIYRVKAVVKPKRGEKSSTNAYWGLVDPNLLNPGHVSAPSSNPLDQMNAQARAVDAWAEYLTQLAKAQNFHGLLGKKQHSRTFCFRGVGHKTADEIELRVENPSGHSNSYPDQGFRGFFTNASGVIQEAVLRKPAGDGDGTVVRSSGAALDKPGKQLPGDRAFDVEHQEAYEAGKVQAYVVQAIIALCKKRYEDLRHPLGNYPAPKT